MMDGKERSGGAPQVLSLAQIQHLMRVEFSRAQRYGYPIACLVVAIDRLGELRDRLGYEAKEALIEAVIDLLDERTRGSDFLGRLPDDRFLVVVPHTPPEGVELLAGRLVESARGLAVPALGGEPVTLSLGGSWTTSGETLFFDDLRAQAERALERAVLAGGDRAELGAPEGTL
jgi:diguanylate cyclase (GGDEF)-like protein